MKPRSLLGKIVCAMCAVFVIAVSQIPLSAQSALQKRNEAELAKAAQAVQSAPSDVNALKAKAMALDNLGRPTEALEVIREAEKIAPGDFSVQMHKGIVLDANGEHQAARETYDKLWEKLQMWHIDRAALLKKGEKPVATPEDSARLAVGLAYPQNSAINHVFLGGYAKALAQFTRDYESKVSLFGSNDDSDYDAIWRVWITAKARAVDGMRADAAVESLADTLKVSTPYHEEMLKLWRGKGHWQKILAAINSMKISDEEKENFLTEAHFFAAGYYRYMKRDNETALELLNAENARPFNGCVERLFIRREIAELRK